MDGNSSDNPSGYPCRSQRGSPGFLSRARVRGNHPITQAIYGATNVGTTADQSICYRFTTYNKQTETADPQAWRKTDFRPQGSRDYGSGFRQTRGTFKSTSAAVRGAFQSTGSQREIFQGGSPRETVQHHDRPSQASLRLTSKFSQKQHRTSQKNWHHHSSKDHAAD